MTTESNELVLYIINTNTPRLPYQRRVNAGRNLYQTTKAFEFVHIAITGAREYEREFANKGDIIFSSADILECAVELNEYYTRHAAECDQALA